ncbi:hypothetical protein B0H21DRAFT_803620 [Amylocystis lapponica]|nr:hypothetical protein B0H21DRAFT_803620 [Amylocystis lapponica]
MHECNTPNVPSFTSLRKKQAGLANDVSVKTEHHVSMQGNEFYSNGPAETFRLDFANPLVRPHIQFYPELGGPVTEFRQGEKWKEYNEETVDINQLMWADWINAPHRHFYIKELAEADDGQLLVPMRWFQENGVACADAYSVAYYPAMEKFIIHSDVLVKIEASALCANYLDLQARGFNPDFGEFAPQWAHQMPHPVRVEAEGRPTFTLRMMCWSDDVSGNKTKQFNPHTNVYLANVNLPHDKLQQEYFIRFCSTSQHASSSEQMEAVLADIGENRWHKAYDCVLGQEVLFRVIPHVLPADNPQQAEHCSHIGGHGNNSCRQCKVGGNASQRESDQGYEAFFSPGSPRTHTEVVREIKNQLFVAGLGVQDEVDALQTASGVKDKTAQYWIGAVIARARLLQTARLSDPQTKDVRLKDRKLKGDERKNIKQEIKRDIQRECNEWLIQQPPSRYDALPDDSPLRKELRPGDHFNVLFSCPKTLNPALDTPCELLHTFLLGEEKYVWHKTNNEWDKKQDSVFAVRLRASSIDGLTLSSVRSDYIVQYKNALVGTHFKILQQLGVFHLYDGLCSDLVLDLWKASGELGAMLWYHTIRNMEQYLSDLEILIANVLDIWVLLDPNRILVKPKLHVLPHIIQDIRRFGPAVLYSTEIFECWNAIFRFCSILSNHQAPSRDIAITLAQTERFKHQVSGGWWRDERGQYVCAGPRVRAFLQSNPAVQRRLGWVDSDTVVSGTVKLETRNNQIPAPWQTACGPTIAAPQTSVSDVNSAPTDLWTPCRYLVSQSKDICKPGSWVFFRHVQSESVLAGRIIKILAPARTCDAVALIQQFNVLGERDPYLNMPILTRGDDLPSVVVPKDVLFIFNAQHDCRTAGCLPTDIENVVQERQTTTRTRSAVAHAPAQRFILNMHALHNAALIRETLPRALTEPKCYVQDRLTKHHEIAAGLRVTGPLQRAQAIAKAAETRARNKAKGTKASTGHGVLASTSTSLAS